MKRTEIIKKLLVTGTKNTIEKFNKLTAMTDKDLEQQYKKLEECKH